MEISKQRETIQEKSFDVLASVKLVRHDLHFYNNIQPETWRRIYDEELSYIAEGINQPVFTEFKLKRTGGELVYFHNGQWRPYLSSLTRAVQVYGQEAAADPRKKFMHQRAIEDLQIGYQLSGLTPGQSLRWKSSFPEEQMRSYGTEFISNLGFQPERRMGFLYEAVGAPDGSLILKSWSVDNSDEQAFTAGLAAKNMLAGYDSKLSQKYGGTFRAGRRAGHRLAEANAWDTVRAHRDLIEDYFMSQIEQLARSSLSDEQLAQAKKRLTYGVWAALKQRLDQGSLLAHEFAGEYGGYDNLSSEVQAAYQNLSQRGEVLFGCGGAIKGEEALQRASSRDVFLSIFGKGEKIKMNCPFCGASQYGDPCAAQLKCGVCEAEVQDGKVVSRGNGGKGANSAGFADLLEQHFGRAYLEWKARWVQKIELNESVNSTPTAKNVSRVSYFI